MYSLSVPVTLAACERYGTQRYIERLRQMDAIRVMISIGSYETDETKRRKSLDSLKKIILEFRQAGFETGVWLWAFMIKDDKQYAHITSPNGGVCADQVCPSDSAFRSFAANYAAALAACGPDLILYDDDYRYGFLPCGLGCACENHRRFMSDALGGAPLPEDLGKEVFGGGENKYRSAFLRANGHFMKQFAREMRAAVDKVNPQIRIGLCACMDVWDFSGVAADELSRLLAGRTKPLLRLIGAPYWSPNKSFGCRLQDVIELERMESAWCEDGVEILSEGDCYPRPRFACSAARLEGFDLALRAAGATHGILKYVFDYSSDPDYERGYVERHLENKPFYRAIDEFFRGKRGAGLRVYERRNKFAQMTVAKPYDGKDDVQNYFFSAAARLAAGCSLPTVYEGPGVAGIAFGENARELPEEAFKRGLILDIRAAEILQAQGVDVGLASVGAAVSAQEEYLPAQDVYFSLNGAELFEIEVADGAEIESFGVADDRRVIASYRYENADGRRFLVFAFDGYFAGDHAFRQYARARQITRAVAYFGSALPALLAGCPEAYLLCSEDENEKAVLVGNFFDDGIENAQIEIGAGWQSADFANCAGRLDGSRVVIDRIAPFACAAFRVKK
ncbi:MAG: hypothetical protein IK080_02285 [Clostridia bacterium]|nr:hypothetical protein [Clostridia bacterium]